MTPGIFGRIGIGSRLDTFLTPHGPSRYDCAMLHVLVQKKTQMTSEMKGKYHKIKLDKIKYEIVSKLASRSLYMLHRYLCKI